MRGSAHFLSRSLIPRELLPQGSRLSNETADSYLFPLLVLLSVEVQNGRAFLFSRLLQPKKKNAEFSLSLFLTALGMKME